MQFSTLFTLLPLLALVSATTASSDAPAVMEHKGSYGEEAAYGHDNDTGDYHDEPEDKTYQDDGNDKTYAKLPEKRAEDTRYAAVPKKTVVIVVAKSQFTSQRTTLTAGAAGAAGTHGPVRYVSPAGRPVTPASSPYMLAINKTFALRINTKENDHLKKNRIYPEKTHCLTVRRRGIRNRFKARVERCNDDQRFWIRSPMSFRFEPAGDETVNLVWMDPKGVKRCAHHDTTGTRFYPCSDKTIKPTRYVILPTDYSGKFKIKQADRNRCFDGDHNNLWMNRCRGFEDQAWDIVTIAYDRV